MHLRLLLLLVLFPFLARAGGEDTLDAYFKTIPRDTSGVRTLTQLSDNISLTDEYVAMRVAEEALAIAREAGDPRYVAAAMNTIGIRYLNQSEYVKASEFLFPALGILDSLGDDPTRLRVLNSLGNLYARQSQYSTAVGYYEKALGLARKTKNRVREGTIVGNLGNIYYMQSESDTSYLRKSLGYYNEALALYHETGQDLRFVTVMNNVMLVYCDLKQFDKALAIGDSATRIVRRLNDSADYVFTLANYGRVYRTSGDYDKALSYYHQSLQLAHTLNNRDMVMENYRNLALCYEYKGDFKNAYKYQEMHTELRDTLVNTENTNIITDLKSTMDKVRSDNEINKLRQDKEISDLANSRQNLYLTLSIGGLVALGVFVFLLFNRARVKERANQQLGHQNLIIAQKNKDITDSINYARRIQESLLVSGKEMARYFPGSFVFFRPRDIVSGDFWWVTEKEGKLFLCAADCTGHGVPGAFMSLLCISFLNEAVVEKGILSPDEIFNHVRTRIIASIGAEGGSSDGMDGVLCRFDTATLQLDLACANNPVWIARNQELLEFLPDKMPVGKFHGTEAPFRLQQVQLQKGDVVYLLSDGFADQFGGPNGKKFKYKPLKQFLLANAGKPMEEQAELLDRMFEDWKGPLEQVDDVLVIGFRV